MMDAKYLIKELRAGTMTPDEIINNYLLVGYTKGMPQAGENTRIAPEVIQGVISDFEVWGGKPPVRLVWYDPIEDVINDRIKHRKK